jgi:hypothetical protein
MRCLSCQYDLSNLTEHRCPECGRAFDPQDLQTFLGDPKPLRSKVTGKSVIALLCLLAAYVVNVTNQIYVDWSIAELTGRPLSAPSVAFRQAVAPAIVQGFFLTVAVLLATVIAEFCIKVFFSKQARDHS